MAKKAKATVRVDNVNVSKERPAATVKFKETKPGLVRATARGLPPIFVKETDKGFKAGVRGDTPVAAKDPAQAFSRAVKANWR
jgi:hypothetical protein